MAIPASGYGSATINNPSSALTDFSLIIDLSRMHADWWTEVNTSDGTRGRAAKNDGTTELACDWIGFDNADSTGLLRVKWSGTLASSGTQIIRIYPPNTANATVAASATYGSDNAYDSNTYAYWPLHDANDRTSNGRDLTGNGGMSFGGVAGHLGDATDFEQSSSQYAQATPNFDFTSEWTATAIVKHESSSADQGVILTVGNQPQLWRDEVGASDRYGIYGGSTVGYGSTAPDTTSWYHVGGNYDGTSDLDLYVDGSYEATGTSGTLTTDSGFSVGRCSYKYMDGLIQHVYVSSVERTAAWFDEESGQVQDQSTFWGTWAWNSSGYTLSADAGTYTLTGTAASLYKGNSLSAESGSFTLTGTDAGTYKGSVVAADSGSFTLTGSDAALLKGYGVSAETGTFSLTGSDASLLYDQIITGGSGSFVLTGSDATLTYAVANKIDAESGSFIFTGSDAGLLHGRRVSAESGAFMLTGNDAALNLGKTLFADPGAFSFTGSDAGLIYNRRIAADSGTFVLTGTDATLSYGAAFVPVDRRSITGHVTQRMAVTATASQSKDVTGEVTQRRSMEATIGG